MQQHAVVAVHWNIGCARRGPVLATNLSVGIGEGVSVCVFSCLILLFKKKRCSAQDRLIGFLRFYQNVYFDERKQRALEICVFGKPASVEAGQNVLYKLAPRLEKGFVSGPLHLFLIVLFVILFVLFLKPKLKAKK